MITKTDVKPLQLPVQPINVQSGIIEQNQNAKLTVDNSQQFSIEVGDFIFDKSAISAQKKISVITNKHVVLVIKNGFYSLLIDGFTTRREAKMFVDQLLQMGFKGTIIKSNS